MDCDLEAGVRQKLVSAVTSHDLTIWEVDLVNPPSNPRHYPPAVAWLMTLKDGRTHELRLFHASWPEPAGSDAVHEAKA
ncbi:hypothetical protein OG352_19660 [Streptomyces sp. NBC_01485]|uniref:hypothetical protein n=1 Tax=Streptomyces sp. NBC_01485 TaxID=2903884 RepID=UPI002E34A1D1|nr:hypothetical protein [Streptomyces sp. NBC_01485]